MPELAGPPDATRAQEARPGADPGAGPGGTWGALMARAQGGDQAAYRRLLTEITPYLRSIAARYHRSREDVEDTVQDVLLSVHAIRHTYDPARPFGPWLATIADRRALDRLRRRLRQAGRETALEPEHETFAAVAANGDTGGADGGLEAAELARAMARLPPGQRQALELLKLKELSLKEASAATGLSITALKVATHRALKSLRVIMQGRR
ncbi:MAG TPA: sigma-70 family RNA polymerase sigma factor [Candidatus Sulfotelmatobacter sp.]|nr:sigma-70 family RNA polymerase sigma factor [Candidatus Sulfotelmatobacter sp.]